MGRKVTGMRGTEVKLMRGATAVGRRMNSWVAVLAVAIALALVRPLRAAGSSPEIGKGFFKLEYIV